MDWIHCNWRKYVHVNIPSVCGSGLANIVENECPHKHSKTRNTLPANGSQKENGLSLESLDLDTKINMYVYVFSFSSACAWLL